MDISLSFLMRVNHMLKTHKVKRKVRGRPKLGKGLIELKEIGRRIRILRGSDNQTEFAEMLEITQGQLSRYEGGTAAPSLESLVRLKKRTGRSIDWIVTGEG
jgi:DNA-binding transcriptional regulator YiaG